MSVIVQLRCMHDADKKAELMSFLVENSPNVRSFSGCFSVDVCFSLDGKEMLLAEQWESVLHHQNYIEYISANGVMQLLRNHLMADPDVSYFEQSSC